MAAMAILQFSQYIALRLIYFYGYINYENLEIIKLFFIMIFLIFLYYNKEPAKLFLGDVGSRLIAVLFLINIFL